MKQFILAATAVALLLAGCATRSISNSGYNGGEPGGPPNQFYSGELKETDLISGDPAAAVTEADIARMLSTAQLPVPRRSVPIMLIQSGALVPDNGMIEAMSRHFSVVPFTGVPPEQGSQYGQRLRLMAAQGGYRQILCYWGLLESQREGGVTKLVSWVPIVGAVVPDESQRMRIDLKAMLIDVETGRWRVYHPEPVEDTAISASLTRAAADQGQVALLKAEGYKARAAAVAASAAP